LSLFCAEERKCRLAEEKLDVGPFFGVFSWVSVVLGLPVVFDGDFDTGEI